MNKIIPTPEQKAKGFGAFPIGSMVEMESTFKARLFTDDEIEDLKCMQDRVSKITNQVSADIMDAKEKAIKKYLLSLGWTPPGSATLSIQEYSSVLSQLEKETADKYAECDSAIEAKDWDNAKLHRGRAEGVARALQLMRRALADEF